MGEAGVQGGQLGDAHLVYLSLPSIIINLVSPHKFFSPTPGETWVEETRELWVTKEWVRNGRGMGEEWARSWRGVGEEWEEWARSWRRVGEECRKRAMGRGWARSGYEWAMSGQRIGEEWAKSGRSESA